MPTVCLVFNCYCYYISSLPGKARSIDDMTKKVIRNCGWK